LLGNGRFSKAAGRKNPSGKSGRYREEISKRQRQLCVSCNLVVPLPTKIQEAAVADIGFIAVAGGWEGYRVASILTFEVNEEPYGVTFCYSP
jgi:hypothetical protein